MSLHTVKYIVKKSKCASLALDIGFSAPKLCSFPWPVKGPTHLCASKKECNKLDLIAAQYFSLVDHNDWSRYFAFSSPHAVPVPVLLVGLPKIKQLNLDISFYYSKWHTEHRWRCSHNAQPIKFHDLVNCWERTSIKEGCTCSPTGHDFTDNSTMSRSLIFKMSNR